MAYLRRLGGIPSKLLSNLKLLNHDPERFARNLFQYTHPAIFEHRLIDTLRPAPMHIDYNFQTVGPPMLNVLDSTWSRLGMTGGPNTVINLVCRLARLGVAVRLVSTVHTSTIDSGWFRDHARDLLGENDFPDIPIETAALPNHPLKIGPRDVFLATHWTTAQQLKKVLPCMPIKQFFYMLQEFEPGFYAWSSNFALAVETYDLDFWPIVNQSSLAEYLLNLPFGRLSDPITKARAVVFEPAVDAKLFFVSASSDRRSRPPRLLFYARPTNPRNMFGLGLTALRQAVTDPAFAAWEFYSIGSRDSVPDLALGRDCILRRSPWMDYTGYGRLLRESDILLCPMLSPHTSYPVIEMAACGGVSITNIFATKTVSVLESISNNIIAVEPTVEGFVKGLLQGARRVNSCKPRSSSLAMPRDWNIALDPVARRVSNIFNELVDAA
jgi:O-antigen biosynthesis protein